MAELYKVHLDGITLQSDLKGVVLAMASILQIDKREAVEKAKKLPVLLASDCTEVQARLMGDMFRNLGASVRFDPPLPPALVPVGPATAHAAAEPVPQAHPHSAWRTFILLVLTLVLALVLVVVGGRWLVEHSHPSPQNSMDLLQKGKMKEARKSLEKQLKTKPDDVDLLVQKGMYFIGAARQKLDAGHWAAYGDGATIPTEGEDLMRLPEADTALMTLQRASHLAPNRAEVQRLLSIVYRQKNLFREAETSARRAVELDPRSSENWNQLGAVLVDLEDYGQAEHVFYSALKVAPDDALTMKNLGVLHLYHNCDTVRASAFLSRYLLTDEGIKDMDRPQLRKDLIYALFGQFNPPLNSMLPDTLDFKTYEDRRKILASQPDAAKNAATQEELGLLYISRRMAGPAEDALLKAVKLDRSREVAWKMLVVLQMQEGNFDKTTNTLRAAVKAGVRDPFFDRNLGMLEKYWKNDASRSRDAWTRYLENSGDGWMNRVRSEMSPS